MLRVLQTNAVSDKVVKLFETLTPKTDFQAKSLLVKVKQPSNDRPLVSDSPLSTARRRRIRRARLAVASGTIRSSWF